MKKAIVIILLLLGHYMACGQGWFELGTGANALNASGGISTICTDTLGNVYVAGSFKDSDYAFAPYYVAKWDHIAHNWSELGAGSNKLNANDIINSICMDKFGNLYAAGDFTDSGSLAFPEGYEYVAKWDGTTWSKLGTGSNALNAHGSINAICVDDSGNVYTTGNFRNSLGQSYVAKWNGTNWTELFGLNANSFIYSICIDDSFNVYAAGYFSNAAGFPYVAKWSKSVATWSELGSGFDTTMADVEITSIRVDSANNVYAAVNVTDTPSSIDLSNVFKCNGAIWHNLGNLNVNNDIYTICLGDSGFVYAGGNFTNASGKYYVAQWSPQTNEWSELGTLNANFGINSLYSDKFGNIYAGGDFTDSISHRNNFQYVAEYGYSSLDIVNLKNDGNKIIVYPNPAHDEINIRTSLQNNRDIHYSLYDIMGNVQFYGTLNNIAFGDTKIIIANLTNGLYLLQLNETVIKIIKK